MLWEFFYDCFFIVFQVFTQEPFSHLLLITLVFSVIALLISIIRRLL